MSVEDFEEYVAILYANNDRKFILQYEVCHNSENKTIIVVTKNAQC